MRLLPKSVAFDNNDTSYFFKFQQGYTVDIVSGEFFDPDGTLVANDAAGDGEQVVIPEVLDDYVSEKDPSLTTSGFTLWLWVLTLSPQKNSGFTLWGNIMPYHPLLTVSILITTLLTATSGLI